MHTADVDAAGTVPVIVANDLGRSHVRWGWFAAWCVVGGLYSLAFLGAFTIGVFVLPFALVATILLSRHHGDVSAIGVVSGLGAPLLYVAYLNRSGPGTICTTTRDGHSCVDEWSPLPWAAVGLILIVGAVVLFAKLRRVGRTGSA